MRALVTGGAGFIGSHLVERLLELGHAVRVLDNFSTGHRSNLSLEADVEIIEGDIQSHERVSRAVKGCEIVFHLAALPSVPRSVQDPLTSNAANATGVLNVLLAARDADVRRVVYASSSSVYGANAESPKHEQLAPMPISPYAVAKLAGEGYCRSFSEIFGLETLTIRYFNVFGPRQDARSQYSAVIPNFIGALLAGQAPVIFGDGKQSRDFTYVRNVVEANVLAINGADAAGEIYNVACGTRVTINQLFAELREQIGTEVEPIYDTTRAGDVRHSVADIGRARTALGYQPLVELREGLALTTDYFRAWLVGRTGGLLGIS